MRSQLTRRVFRRILYNELYSTTRSWSPPTEQCLRVHRTAQPPSKRFFFGFSRKIQRQPKPVIYDPGYEVMLELDRKLSIGARTPPPAELAKGFLDFFESRQTGRPLEEIQAKHALLTFEHLQKDCAEEDDFGISSDDLRLVMRRLKIQPTYYHKETYIRLASSVFEELKRRTHRSSVYEQVPGESHSKDLASFIQILSQYGDALSAQDLVMQNWENCLEKLKESPWLQVLRGMMKEERGAELRRTIRLMQGYNIPFDSQVHETIVTHFVMTKKNIEGMKEWYSHPIAQGGLPTAHTDLQVLRFCVFENELEWAEPIFKSRVGDNPAYLSLWNLVFLWAAAQGKSVDEIERLMQMMVEKTKEPGEPLQPTTGTINRLIAFAISRNDPYTAERYVGLGERWGCRPDARTYLLQLEYRIKVGDLGGARAAYAHFKEEEGQDDNGLPLVNRLIVALCSEKRQDYDAIMGIAEDLSERKARFESVTVAALCDLHLQRGGIDDLTDLLNTHVHHFGLKEQAAIRAVLVEYCLNIKSPTSVAWDTYNILRRTFPETDTTIRTSLMQSFFLRKRPDIATHVFSHMRQQQVRSLRPTASIYATCFAGIGRAGDTASLGTVHNMMKLDTEIEPSTQLYNALMIAYDGCGESQRALDIWDEIVDSMEGPSYASIQIALRCCENEKTGEEPARDIWDKLKRFDIEITREIYAAYIGALAGSDLFDDCVKLIGNAEKEVGQRPDALMLGTFYNATPGIGSKQEVEEWASKAHTDIWQDLLKLGQYSIVRSGEDDDEDEDDDEEMAEFREEEMFFNIGPLGRDVEP